MEQVEQRPSGTVRLAAVGDVHCTKQSQGVPQPIFAAIAAQADVLALDDTSAPPAGRPSRPAPRDLGGGS